MEQEKQQYIAVDLVAENGRLMLGIISYNKLRLQEVYRFGNDPIEGDPILPQFV
jgi:hypothetical protein